MINDQQKRFLRGRSHQLKPVVMIGQAGLTPAVLVELETALDHHELIKVQLSEGDRDQRRRMIDDIAADTRADVVLAIGNRAVFFRANPKKRHPMPVPS